MELGQWSEIKTKYRYWQSIGIWILVVGMSRIHQASQEEGKGKHHGGHQYIREGLRKR